MYVFAASTHSNTAFAAVRNTLKIKRSLMYNCANVSSFFCVADCALLAALTYARMFFGNTAYPTAISLITCDSGLIASASAWICGTSEAMSTSDSFFNAFGSFLRFETSNPDISFNAFVSSESPLTLTLSPFIASSTFFSFFNDLTAVSVGTDT